MTQPERGEVDAAEFSTSEDRFMRNIIDHAVARGWGEPIDRKMTRKEKAEKLRPYHVTLLLFQLGHDLAVLA